MSQSKDIYKAPVCTFSMMILNLKLSVASMKNIFKKLKFVYLLVCVPTCVFLCRPGHMYGSQRTPPCGFCIKLMSSGLAASAFTH